MTTSKQIREEIKDSLRGMEITYTLTPWKDANAYAKAAHSHGLVVRTDKTDTGLLVRTNNGRSILFRKP